MDGWTDGLMDGRTDGWMDTWMDGWTDGRLGGWLDGWMVTQGRHPGSTTVYAVSKYPQVVLLLKAVGRREDDVVVDDGSRTHHEVHLRQDDLWDGNNVSWICERRGDFINAIRPNQPTNQPSIQ